MLRHTTCTSGPLDIDLECDGRRIDLKSFGVEGVIILNIPSYGGGTNLWAGAQGKSAPQNFSDGLLEVVGELLFSCHIIDDRNLRYFLSFFDALIFLSLCKYFTATFSPQFNIGVRMVDLANSQVGHIARFQLFSTGIRLSQCSEVKVTMKTKVPMQVDGEPIFLDFDKNRFCERTITISRSKNRALMLKPSSPVGNSSKACDSTEAISVIDWANVKGVITEAQRDSIVAELLRRHS